MKKIDVDIDRDEWDRTLARLGGHPWQSAFWGCAQSEIEGSKELRLRLRDGTDTIQMVRVEERHVKRLGKLAWIRRGPTSSGEAVDPGKLEPELADWLGNSGFLLAVSSPWYRCEPAGTDRQSNQSRTIWVDLSIGVDALWSGLERNFRNDVGRARRKGVSVEVTADPARIAEYGELYRQLGEAKGFSQRMTPEMIQKLATQPSFEGSDAHLFLAIAEGEIAAGALICRCGNSVSYMNGASNRKFSKLRPAEALHWSVMEWAVAQGCHRYELEGIDPEGNPGVYAFKKKMGGEEITLPPRQVEALNLKGRMIKPLADYVLNSRSTGFHSFAQGFMKRSA